VKEGPFVTRGAGPEITSHELLGPFIGNLDMEFIILLGDVTNNYGMDWWQTGYDIAWAMELYQRGIITKEDTDGVALDWGDPDAILYLVESMAKRKGFGNILAEGSANAKKIIRKDSWKYDQTTRGLGYIQSSPAENGDPRAAPIDAAIAHFACPRGADMQTSFASLMVLLKPSGSGTWEDRIRTWKNGILLAAGIDSLGFCQRIGDILNIWADGVFAELLSLLIGFDISNEELVTATERILALERAFIVRQGITRKQEVYPWRLTNEPIPDGPYKGRTCPPQEETKKYMDYFFKIMGYDPETGAPTRETLERLNLKEVADELETNMPYPDWDGPPLWPLDKYPYSE